MKKITIVVPAYNEQENIQATYEAVTGLFRDLADRYDYEIIFSDNHSSDNTFALLRLLAKKDPRVKAVRYSKNFGYQRSIFSALKLSEGDAAVILDCDLQDPPELIGRFLEKWEGGHDVVYGVRVKRDEHWLMAGLRKLYYRVINKLSDEDLPLDAGDFRLVDRKVLDILKEIYDYNPYLRGLIAIMGFSQIGIPYERRARRAGRTKFSMRQIVKLGLDGIVNHSVRPLKLATLLGFTMFFSSLGLMSYYVLAKIFFKPLWPEGLTVTVALILLSISVNALLLGIMGEYIARIFQQTKGYPITIIEESVNLRTETRRP